MTSVNKKIIRLVRRIYNYIPLKKNIFILIKRMCIPPHKIYKNLYFKGVFNVIIDDEHCFNIRHYGYGFSVENDIFWAGINGGWEKESTALWIKLCKKKQTVLDIGANTGIYSLLAKELNYKSNVYALEPVCRVFQKLEENNKLNNYDIVCLPYAASNYNGKATIHDPGTEHIYSVTVNMNLNTSYETQEVEIQTIKIDTLIKNYNIQNISLIKIDVETHEPEVLEGFSEYIKLYHPSILIEVLKDEIGERIEDVLNMLGCNYLYFNIDEMNGAERVAKIRKSNNYNYLLCTEQIAEELNLIKQ